ncbi:hypothetical protein CMV_011357 [Castanea mollissima]|uniref:Uncharacterized protein n=1 Tax=Castanea mollissima TaxID=60419 RepID=A0A8J4W027_9ROSI|nr:hypothetical protein CMV_011357 [Castanea mollissima]
MTKAYISDASNECSNNLSTEEDGLLVIIFYHVGPLGSYLFPWALMAYLLLSCFFHSFPFSSPFTIWPFSAFGPFVENGY